MESKDIKNMDRTAQPGRTAIEAQIWTQILEIVETAGRNGMEIILRSGNIRQTPPRSIIIDLPAMLEAAFD